MDTGTRSGSRRGLLVLGASLFVTMVGFGLAMPVLPGRVQELDGSGASYGILVAIAAATMLVAGPVWGAFSDRVGRKPVLIVGLVGLGGSLVGFALARSMGVLLVTRAATGLLAAAVQPATLAYAADMTDQRERGGVIGRLMGGLSLGVVVGPGLGGLLGEGSFARPLLIGAVMTAVSALLVLLFVPETHHGRTEPRRQPTATMAREPTGAGLRGLLALVAIATYGTSCFQAVFGLDAARRFLMTPALMGLMLVVIGAAAALMQGLAAGLMSRRLGDAQVARLSFVGGAVGFVALGLSGTAGMYVAATGLYVLTHALLRPSLQTLVSREAGGRQGRALGLANAAQGLGATLGPLAAGPLLDTTPALPYAMGAVVLLAGLCTSYFLIPKGVVHDHQHTQSA